MAESLEYAQERTRQFINFVKAEVTALGIDLREEPMLEVAELSVPHLTDPAQHYELREQLAGVFSSVAYKYVTRKWKKSADVIV